MAGTVRAFLRAVSLGDEREVGLLLHDAAFEALAPGTRVDSCRATLGLSFDDLTAIVDKIEPGRPFPGSAWVHDQGLGAEMTLRSGSKSCAVDVRLADGRWRVIPISRQGPLSRLVDRIRRRRLGPSAA